MTSPINRPSAPAAILVLAAIKASIETFDSGEANAFDTVDAIIVQIESYQSESQSGREAA